MQKVSKYSLRKKTIGLASVMVGSVFGVSVNADADVNNDVREKAESTKHGKLIINYYIEGTTTKIADSYNDDRPIGETYSEYVPTIAPKHVREDVPGDSTKFKYVTTTYELVSKPVNANGVITEGETVVNYYYRPVITENIYNKGGDIVIYHTDSSFDVQHVFDEELEKDVRGFNFNNSLFLNHKYGTKTSVFRGVYDAAIGMKDNGNPDIPSKEYAIAEQTKFVKMLGYDSIDNYNRIHKESAGNGDKPLTLGDVGVAHTWQRTGTTIPGPVTSSYYNISSDIVDFDTRGHLGADLDVFEGKDAVGLNQYDSMIPSGAELEVTKLTYNIDGGEEKVAPTKGYTYSRDNGTMVKGKTTHFTYHYKLKKREEIKESVDLKGSVVVKYVDTNGNEIKDAVKLVTDAPAGSRVTKDIISGTALIRTKTEVIDGTTKYDANTVKDQTITKNGKTYTLKRVLPKDTNFNNTDVTSGIVKGGTTTVVYEYSEIEKDSVTANYYKEGTTEKLADSEVQNEKVIGSDYTTTAKIITPKVTTQDLPDRTVKRSVSYELVKTPENATGKVVKGGTTVNYYYREVVKEDVVMKKDTVTSNYYKEGTTEKLADSEVQNELVIGTDYKTKSKVIEPKVTVDDLPDRTVKRTVTYVLVKEPDNKTGKVAQGGMTVNYYYKEIVNEEVTMKKDAVTANYYKEGTEEKLADSVVQNALVIGTDYTTKAKVIEPKVETKDYIDRTVKRTTTYELVKEPENQTGKVVKGGTTVNYYYKEVVKEDVTMKKDSVTANYYKEGTTEKLADSVVQNELVIGTDYKTESKTIAPKVTVDELPDRTVKRTITYTLVKEPENKTGKVVKGGTTVNYYYSEVVKEDVTMKKDSVIANYYKEGTTEKLADSVVQNELVIGTDYKTESKTIAPKVTVEELPDRTVKRTITYTLMKDPENKTGKVIKGGTTVNYYYKEVVKEDITMKKDSVTANYYKEGTTEKLADSEVQNELTIGTDYKTESKTITPKVTVEELPDRTVKRTVTYTLVKEPENKTGKVVKGGTTVNYYYKEVVKEDITMKKDGVVANYYKEGTTEKLADSVVETDKVIGTDYETKAKVIEPKVSAEELEDKTIKRIVSYELVGAPQNATGKIVKGGVVVNYYYRENVKEEATPKYSNVVINHYKYGTTEKVSDTETRPNVPIGSSYTTDPKVIPPKVVVEEFPNRTVKRTITYVPVEPANKNGKVVKGGVVVNYYYKEVVKEDITKKEEPVKPTEPTKPIEPKAPVKPGIVKPTEPKKPVEPAKLVTKEPMKPTEPGKFTLEKPVKPTEPVKPRKPIVDPNDGDFAETKKPIAPVKPVEPTKPTMEQPVEPVKPEMEKPTEPVKPAAEKPVEPVKPKEEPKVEEPKVKEEQLKVEPKEQPKKKLPETGDTTNLAVMGLGALIAARRLRRKEQ